MNEGLDAEAQSRADSVYRLPVDLLDDRRLAGIVEAQEQDADLALFYCRSRSEPRGVSTVFPESPCFKCTGFVALRRTFVLSNDGEKAHSGR